MSEWGHDPELTEPEPGGGSRTAVPGALLCLTAAMLTMIGMFQQLFTAQASAGPAERQRVTISGWDFRIEFDGVQAAGENDILINGAPLAFAVAALLAAALGLLLAARRSAAWLARVGRLTALVGATFLAATVCTIGVQELFWLDVFQPPPSAGPGSRAAVGPGFWSLVTGTAVAVVATAVAWRSGRPDPRRLEPETPALGIPVVVRRLPDEPPPDHDGS